MPNKTTFLSALTVFVSALIVVVTLHKAFIETMVAKTIALMVVHPILCVEHPRSVLHAMLVLAIVMVPMFVQGLIEKEPERPRPQHRRPF